MIKFLICIAFLVSPAALLTFDSVPTSPDGLGQDNPHWDVQTDSVYFVDYFGVLLFRYSLRDNTTQTLTVDGITYPAFFVPVEGTSDKYVVGSNQSAYIIDWDGSSDSGTIERTVFTVAPDSLLNSAFTTAAGELYTGTYGPTYCAGTPTQSFYRYTEANDLEVISSHFTSTVGTVIIENTLYHLDGCQQLLSAFDRDPATGALSNERQVLQMQFGGGNLLVGMTADQDGFLYSGLYGGSEIIKIDPRLPAVVDEIPMPTPIVSAMTFGGPEDEILFVNTANQPINPYIPNLLPINRDPPAGNLFLISGNDAPGFPSYRARV